MHMIKKTLKRVAAGATGLAVLGMTLTGALAADYTLDSYPTPFTGSDTVLVVGAEASAQDTVAQENVATSLTTTTTTITGGGDLTFEEGAYEDPELGVALNDATAFGTSLDDNDGVNLLEGEVNIHIGSDKDYDFHEEILFSATAISSTALGQSNEDFEDQVFIVLPKETLTYNFTFEDNLDAGNYFNDSTTASDIDMSILGKDLTVRSATSNSLTAVVGDKIALNAGDVVSVGDHTVKLIQVGASTAQIEIDGEVFSKGTADTIDKKGLEVYIDSVFDEEDKSQDSAVLVIGTEAIKTYTNGNAYWDEDETYYLWKWNLANLDSANPQIGVTLAMNMNDPEKTLDDKIVELGLTKDDKRFMVEGDYLCLPHKYACFVFEENLGDQDQKTVTFDVSNEAEDLYNTTGITNAGLVESAADVIVIESSIKEDAGLVVDGYDTKAAVLVHNGTGVVVYPWDKDNGQYALQDTTPAYIPNVTTGVALKIENGDFLQNVFMTAQNATYGWNLTVTQPDSGVNFTFGATNTVRPYEYLGTKAGEDTGTWVYYGSTAIDSYSFDVLSLEGVKVFNPENNVDNDQVVIAVPNDNDYKLGLRVAMPSGGMDSSSTDTNAAYSTMLDTELTDMTGYNVIAIGGPAVNMVSAQLLGVEYPAFAAASGIAEGQAVLELMPNGDDNWALVVAGWDAENTLAAASLLENYADNDFSAMSAISVMGTVAAGVTFE